MQETLHFDPVSGRISSLRSKEEAHDYRYFPEPDLVPLVPTPEMMETARAAIPELPAERAARYERGSGWPRTPRTCSRSSPSGATTSSRRRTGAGRQGDRELGDRAALARRRVRRPGRRSPSSSRW